MSDIGISIPLPILLVYIGALYWPVTLVAAAVAALLGAVLPWLWVRVACFLLAAVLAADGAFALWLKPD